MGRGRRRVVGWFGLGAVLLLAPWVVWSALRAVRVGEASPALECTQRVYEFGESGASTAVEHEFVLENRGSGKLTGLTAMPDCGCMAATLSGERVEAGGKVNLHVRMDVRGYHGAMEKKVYVRAGEGIPVVLVLRGVVGPVPAY